MTTVVVVAVTVVAVLWLTTRPASADPAGWEIDNSGGWLPGPCPDWVDTDPEDVTCTPHLRSTGKTRDVQWGHVNYWTHPDTGDDWQPIKTCSKRWELEDYLPAGTTVQGATDTEYEVAKGKAVAAAKIGSGCLHNLDWPWKYEDHAEYVTQREEVKLPEHRWVRRKAEHTNCGTDWPESHIHPDGELDVPDAPKDAAEAGLNHFHWTVRVTWKAPDDDGGCPVLGYEVRVTAANDPPGTAPVTHQFTDTRFPHEEPVPTVATGVKTVEIRARNVKGLGDPARVRLHPRCPRGTDHQGDLISSVEGGTETGCNDNEDDKEKDPPEVCESPPSTPVLTREADKNGRAQVSWEVANDGDGDDDLCEITAQEMRITRPRHTVSTPSITKTAERYERVPLHPRCPRGTDHQGDLISSVDGGTEAGCNDGPPPEVCPSGTTHAGKLLTDPAVGGTVEGCDDDDKKEGDGCAVPAAPVLTASGTGSSRAVTWTVDDPAGEDCAITGQELRRVPQRGISSTRARDKNTRESTQSVTDRTGAVVVSVRAKNRAQPGGSTEQWGNSGWVDLHGDDVTGGALRRTHR